VSAEISEPNQRKSRFSFYVGLFNLLLGVGLFASPWVLLLFKDFLPYESPLVFSGGGIIVAFVTWPLSILFSVTGIIMMLVAKFSRKSARPEGSPLTGKNKTALVFSGIFLLIALQHIVALAGVR
jgi:hypothetical protein